MFLMLGGSTMFPAFPSRLAREVKSLVPPSVEVEVLMILLENFPFD